MLIPNFFSDAVNFVICSSANRPATISKSKYRNGPGAMTAGISKVGDTLVTKDWNFRRRGMFR